MTRRARELFNPTERLYIVLDNSSTTNTPVFDKDDIKDPIKKRLGDYLSRKTIEGGNTYTIQPGSREVLLVDGNGNPSAILDSGNAGANNTSYEDISASAKASFDATSHTGQLDSSGDPFTIKKGKSSDTAPSGRELLKDVDENLDQSAMAKRIQRVLKENNRFNSDNPFLDPNGSTDENNSNLTITQVQTQLGVHYPRKFPTAVESPNSSVIDIRNLKKLGALTLLHASGEVVVPKEPNSIERFTTLAPGLARLGLKVPISRFNPINVYKGIDENFTKKASTGFIGNDDRLSYGSPLNYAAPFDGIASTPSIVACNLLIITVSGIVKAFTAIIAPSNPTGIESFRNTGGPRQRRKFLGSYLGKTDVSNNSLTDAVKNILDLKIDTVQTENDFKACVSRGLNVFFGYGIDGIPSTSIATNVAGATDKIVKIHGYYNTVLRNIVRSTTDLALPGIIAGAGITNKDPGTSAQAANTLVDNFNPLTFAEKLNNTILLKFVNILATIGDISLNLQRQGADAGEDTGSLSEILSSIDLIEESDASGRGMNPAVAHAKSRLNNGKLAWRNTSVKSMYLFPNELFNQSERFNQKKSGEILEAMSQVGADGDSVNDIQAANFVPNSLKIDNGSRIKAEVVEQMENYLEKDYVPFYFHDLRTNEIINFHAFLEDVSDEYRASYDETEGYGRVDKVMTYKNTSRNITLTFKTVATDPEDFDLMWFKVNKLITMVYPQWSEGRQVSWGNNKFTQPFSQYPSASPLIRLRVGDYIKSNRSKFALARLFGVSTDPAKFSLDRINRAQNGATTFETQRRIVAAMANIRRTMEGETLTPSYQNGDFSILRANAQSGIRRTSIVGSPTYFRVADTGGTSTVASRTRPNSPNRRGANSAEVNATANGGLVLHYDTKVTVIGRSDVRGTINSYIVQVSQPAEGQSGQFVVPFDALYPDSEYVERKARQQVLGASQNNTNNQTTDEAVNAFLSDTQNPIFQSFQSTSGRGLAGFITSIRLDSSNALWTTGELNKRAPQLLSIQLEFSPVHDIAPGIDANGFNTAPLYNVGGIMKKLGKEENFVQLDSDMRQAYSRLKT